MLIKRSALGLGVLLLLSCERAQQPGRTVTSAEPVNDTAAPVCRAVEVGVPLPPQIPESSGVTPSVRMPGMFWTINDEDDGRLFLVDDRRRLVATFDVLGAAEDWEALGMARCDGAPCLIIGDTGDNQANRDHIAIVIVPEPAATDIGPLRPTILRARFPVGPQNTESIFTLPNGELYLVTKGDQGPVTLYRYPAPRRTGEIVVLEPVRVLAPQQERYADQVTGAAASPNGRWVAIRTYRHLRYYRAKELVSERDVIPAMTIELSVLAEPKGEGVAIDDNGQVWLGSESRDEKKSGRSTLARLRCTLPSPAQGAAHTLFLPVTL